MPEQPLLAVMPIKAHSLNRFIVQAPQCDTSFEDHATLLAKNQCSIGLWPVVTGGSPMLLQIVSILPLVSARQMVAFCDDL